MIEAKEIKLGVTISYSHNEYWVEEIKGKPVIVDIDIIQELFFNPERFDPIPLSETCLIACGFEDLHGEFAPHFKKEQMEIEVVDGKYMARLKWDGCPTSLWLANLNHIHQLQNLYFALTGTELSYNPIN